MINPVKLSVCMITYNQEKYVRQAIESVLEQKTNFQIELVVGDDASKDNTAAIISSLTAPTSVTMKPLLRQSNLGMLQNFTQTLQHCTGKYIALLEGDDYWIDINKLQRQVDFLDNNPDFSICYHPVKIDTDSDELAPDNNRPRGDVSDIYELAQGNFMHTCSVVYRSGLFERFPDSFYRSTVGDYFLHMLNAQYGKIRRLPEAMGVYRVHSGGIWSMQPNMDQKILTYLEAMVDSFEPDVAIILKKRHQTIAVKALLQNIGKPDFDARLRRSIQYGSEELHEAFLEMDRRTKSGRLLDYLRRVKKYL